MAVNKYDLIFSDDDKKKLIEEYINGNSIRELCDKHNIKCKAWLNNVLKNVTRSTSESQKLAHKKHPEKFLHTEETKAIMREKRLKYMKEHPENTAWRKRNEPSYPEKCFIKFLIENGYDKKYLIEREHQVFPFYIDFAFLPIKVAVEIDGSQHIKVPERAERDRQKDDVLINNGWKVLRVSENLVKTDWKILKETFDRVIGSDEIFVEKVGIFFSKKKKKKVKKDANGYSEKMLASYINARKVKNRPSLEEIKKLLETNSMVSVGKMFGVSDNTIRKWIRLYEKQQASESD